MREKKRVKKGVVAPFDHLNELLEEEGESGSLSFSVHVELKRSHHA